MLSSNFRERKLQISEMILIFGLVVEFLYLLDEIQSRSWCSQC